MHEFDGVLQIVNATFKAKTKGKAKTKKNLASRPLQDQAGLEATSLNIVNKSTANINYPDVWYAVSSPDGASVADDGVKLERDNTRVAACSAHSSQLDGLLGGVTEA